MKTLFLLSLLVLASCAQKDSDRYRICEEVVVSCKTGDCPQVTYKDINTNEIVDIKQCDEVRSAK